MSTTKTKKAETGYDLAGINMLLNLQKSSWLPAYEKDGKRLVTSQILELFGHIESTIETVGKEIDDVGILAGVLIHHVAALRNKRILFGYHQYRMDAICDLRWEKGTELDSSFRSKMTHNEENYFRGYSTLVAHYMRDTGIDYLTTHLEPPKRLQTEFGVIEDVDEAVLTEYGSSILLDQHTRKFVDQSDVKMMIRCGKVVPTKPS